jgi:hypothetical protein
MATVELPDDQRVALTQRLEQAFRPGRSSFLPDASSS